MYYCNYAIVARMIATRESKNRNSILRVENCEHSNHVFQYYC